PWWTRRRRRLIWCALAIAPAESPGATKPQRKTDAELGGRGARVGGDVEEARRSLADLAHRLERAADRQQNAAAVAPTTGAEGIVVARGERGRVVERGHAGAGEDVRRDAAAATAARGDVEDEHQIGITAPTRHAHVLVRGLVERGEAARAQADGPDEHSGLESRGGR